MSSYPIYLCDVEDLNVLPEPVRDQVAKLEGLGYKREDMHLDAQQQVHHSAGLANDDMFSSNDGGSGDV